MIVNGDLSQVDLPSGTKSGLRESINILKDIKDIGFIEFEEGDQKNFFFDLLPLNESFQVR